MLGIVVNAIAQPRAIGGRLGFSSGGNLNLEFSYQHGIGKGFLEVDAGGFYFSHPKLPKPTYGITASVIYDWIFATPSWTSKGIWNWYAGVGGTGIFRFNGEYVIKEDETGYIAYNTCHIGVAGQIGLSYTFWFPLQLSLDFRPTIGPSFYYDPKYNHYKARFDVWELFVFALGVRYSFGAGK